jgi:hypothetical protein
VVAGHKWPPSVVVSPKVALSDDKLLRDLLSNFPLSICRSAHLKTNRDHLFNVINEANIHRHGVIFIIRHAVLQN